MKISFQNNLRTLLKGKLPRFVVLLQNWCYRIHAFILMIPMLLLPPVHSILILVSTILKTYNGSVVDEYNSKINVIKQPFSKLKILALCFWRHADEIAT